MLESICGQGFAYARKVEEDWQKKLVKLEPKATEERLPAAEAKTIFLSSPRPAPCPPFYKRRSYDTCVSSLVLVFPFCRRHNVKPKQLGQPPPPIGIDRGRAGDLAIDRAAWRLLVA
jgi:hypothetical protein